MSVAVVPDESIVTERILNAALKRIGYQMRLEPSGMRTAVQNTVNGDTDILAVFADGLEKQHPELIRIPVSYSKTNMTAYARDGRRFVVRSWTDLSNLRVCYIQQNLYISQHVRKYARDPIAASNADQLMRTLLANEADVAVMILPGDSERVPPQGIKQIGVIEELANYSYINKRRSELAEPLTKALRDMQADGSMEKIKSGKAEGIEKMLIHITSYSSEVAWERDVDRGVHKGLGAYDTSAAFHFNLNARRTSNIAAQYDGVAANIRATLIERRPDVVIASDNEALAFVVDRYDQLFAGVPVVFCGVTDFGAETLRGTGKQATGCTESISASATVREMLRMYPSTKHIYVVNDHTDVGIGWRDEIKRQLDRLGLGVSIAYSDNLVMTDLQKKLRSLGDDTLVLLGSYSQDGAGVYWSEEDVQRLVSVAIRTPLFALISTSVGSGALGGMVVDAESQGYTAGGMARQILDGAPPEAIPIVHASESLNEWVFDYQVLKRFGIDKRSLPDRSRFVNRSVSFWESHPREIAGFVAVVLLFLAVIAALLLYASRLKKKNEALLTAEGPDVERAGGAERVSAKTLNALAALMEKAPFSFAVIADERIEDANECGRNDLGLARGRRVSDVYPAAGIFEKTVKKLAYQDSISGEVTFFAMPDGEMHRHSVSYIRAEGEDRTCYLLFAIDIEELERCKEHNKRTQGDIQKILGALPSALAIIDGMTGELEYANGEFAGMLGDFPIGAIAEQFLAVWQGHTVSFECDCNGALLKMYADQIVFRGKNCVVMIGQDVTADKRRAEMLTKAAEKEKEANLLKGVFLANMSHEIRTPMNAIIGLSQLALMKEQTRENSDLFHKISLSAKNLLSIINDILDFSKIEAEKLDFVEDVFSLEETIVNAFLVAVERIEDKNLEVLLDMAPDVPYYLVGDKTRLWQVLKNVLDNAVKYTPAGRIVLSVSVSSADEESTTLRFNVKDTGAGMSEEQIARLFTPFTQFHRYSTQRAGTGLGMAITKKLVDMMKGVIGVTSEVGAGTDFNIVIPFKIARNHKTMQDFMIETVGNLSENVGSILLVDDDENSLTLMSAILKNVGIASVCATNADDAMKLVEESVAKETPFGIIIIDYLLGGEVDGIGLARRINVVSEHTKLLMVTAYTRRLISEDALHDAGFRDVIEKPFVISTFLQKVCSVIPELTASPKEEKASYPDARVLVCEDNEINQLVVEGLLENFDIVPRMANDGAEALSILEKESFDLILMDIMMPVMDGHEATKAIRGSGKPYQNIPIVAMTANVMPDEIERYLKEGMNGHIAKPIDMEEFQSVLFAFLSRQDDS